MNIANFFTPLKWRGWRAGVRNEVMNEASDVDAGVRWFAEVSTKSFDELPGAGGMPRLYQELASALTRAQTGDMVRRIATKE